MRVGHAGPYPFLRRGIAAGALIRFWDEDDEKGGCHRTWPRYAARRWC